MAAEGLVAAVSALLWAAVVAMVLDQLSPDVPHAAVVGAREWVVLAHLVVGCDNVVVRVDFVTVRAGVCSVWTLV